MNGYMSRGVVLSAAFVLLWTSGYLVGTVGTRAVPALTLTFWRFTVAALALAVIAVLTRAPWPRGRRAWAHLGLTGALLQGVQFVGVYLALSRGVSAGLASLVISLSPLLVAAGAVPLFGERLTRTAWLGAALGIGGVALASAGRLTGTGGLAGIGLAGLGLLGFTAGTLYQKRFGVSMDLRTGGTVQLAAAALLLTPIAALHGGLALPLTAPALGSVAWLALANSIGGFSLLFVLLRHRRGAAATSLLYLVPPVTAVLAWPLLGQPLDTHTVAGLGLTTLGVSLLQRAERHRATRETDRIRVTDAVRHQNSPSRRPPATLNR